MEGKNEIWVGVNDKIMRQAAAHIDRESASGYATASGSTRIQS